MRIVFLCLAVAGLCLAVTASSVSAENWETYTIKKGDRLSAIAEKHDVTVDELVRANKEVVKNKDVIYPGEILKIPVEKSAEKEEEEMEKEPEESLMFKGHQGLSNGWVIDDTKTPIGKKFYRAFTNHWEQPVGLNDYSIAIVEQPIPTSGLSSRLTVKIGDLLNQRIIYRNILSPRTGDIEEQVQVCISRIHRYLEQQESLQEQMEKLRRLQRQQQQQSDGNKYQQPQDQQ